MTDEKGQFIRSAKYNPISLTYSPTLKPRSAVLGSRVEFAVRIRSTLVHHRRTNPSISEMASETFEEMNSHRMDKSSGWD